MSERGGPIALAVGSALAAAGMALHAHGSVDEDFVRSIADHSTQWMSSHLLSGIGLLLVAAGALTVAGMVKGRGGRWVAVGSSMAAVGAALMALGDMAHGAVGFALANQVEPDKSLAIQEEFFRAPAMGVLMGAGMLLPLGVIVLSVGLLRSRAVSRWVAVVLLVSPIVVQAGLSGAIPSFFTGVPFVVGLTALAWTRWSRDLVSEHRDAGSTTESGSAAPADRSARDPGSARHTQP